MWSHLDEAKSDFTLFEHWAEPGCDFLCLTVSGGFVEDGTKHLWDSAYHIPIFCGCKDLSCNVCMALNWTRFTKINHIKHFYSGTDICTWNCPWWFKDPICFSLISAWSDFERMFKFIWAVASYCICPIECLKLLVIAPNVIGDGWAFFLIFEPLDLTGTKYYLW